MRTRPIVYTFEQIRSFDFGSMAKDVITAFGDLTQILFGSNSTIISHFAATADGPPDMSVNFDQGWIGSYGPIDTTDYGALNADSTSVFRLGYSIAQALQFSITGSVAGAPTLSAGQNVWALVYCALESEDSIRQGDPDNGILKFFDSANPLVALEGPGGSGNSLPTMRAYVANLQILYGTPASAGTEAPPTCPAGAAPLYLIDLAYGQSAITQAEIKVAGPSAGVNCSGYPVAPFAAGLYTQHHLGGAGQAPQIDLTSEVKNVLPLANLPTGYTSGQTRLPNISDGTANPNGSAGIQDDLYVQHSSGNQILWVCMGGTTWNSIYATAGGSGTPAPTSPGSFPATIASSGNYICNVTVDSTITLPVVTGNFDVTIVRSDSTNTAQLQVLPNGTPSGQTINGQSSYYIVKGGDSVRLISDTVSNWTIVGGFWGA